MDVKVSYLLPAYRGFYASRLFGEIARKTTVPYEFLVWLNLDNKGLEAYIQGLISSGYPIRIVGSTPENIGMRAFKPLIEQARGEYLVQLEDDVLFISRRAMEVADDILRRRPEIGMLSAELWQDEFSNGGHPGPDHYKVVSEADQLYEGPIDGGFSVYPRSSVPILLQADFRPYFGLGAETHCRLNGLGKKAYKTRRMRMFHIAGPTYHSLFAGMIEFEIEKYKRVGHQGMVEVFETQRMTLPPRTILDQRFRAIDNYHDAFSG